MHTKILFLSLISLITINLNGMNAAFESKQKIFDFLRRKNPGLPTHIYRHQTDLVYSNQILKEQLVLHQKISALQQELVKENTPENQKAQFESFQAKNNELLHKHCPRLLDAVSKGAIDVPYITYLMSFELRTYERILKKNIAVATIHEISTDYTANNMCYKNIISALYNLLKDPKSNATFFSKAAERFVFLCDVIEAMHHPFIPPVITTDEALKQQGCVKDPNTGRISFTRFRNFILPSNDMREKLDNSPNLVTKEEFGELVITDVKQACPCAHQELSKLCPAGIQKAKDFETPTTLLLGYADCSTPLINGKHPSSHTLLEYFFGQKG